MLKRVLITGASGGIGAAAARKFALNGYYVILHCNSNYSNAEYLKDMFDKNGCESKIVRADMSDDSQIKKLAEEAHGVEVLVNNAGVALTKQFTDCSDEELCKIININMLAAMKLTKLLLPEMLRRKSGRIINVSSMWGITGASCEVAYSASKAGLIGFTKALAKEVGPSGICVNCVAPGIIKTDMLGEYSEDTLKELAGETPLRRLGEPSEAASLIYYLASESAGFITGQVISPNGGFVI